MKIFICYLLKNNWILSVPEDLRMTKIATIADYYECTKTTRTKELRCGNQ